MLNEIVCAPCEGIESSAYGRTDRSVLIIDDEPQIQEIIMESLCSWQIDFHTACDCQEVLISLANFDYDCIFLDLVLPRYSGVDISEAVRQHERQSFSRPAFIVGMTSRIGGRERKVCLDSGVNGYINRPIDPRSVRAAYTGFLEYEAMLAY